jgi:hypothetical protein
MHVVHDRGRISTFMTGPDLDRAAQGVTEGVLPRGESWKVTYRRLR